MKKLILCCALISFLFAQSFAQNTGEIKGTIYDETSKQTLPGASVYVKVGDNLVGVLTDLNGNYTIKPLNAGIYNVTIKYTGMETVIINNVNVSPAKITFIDDQYLAEVVITLDKDIATIIEWKDKIIDPDPKFTIRPKEFKSIAGNTDLTKIISSMSSDIMVTENKELYFRGSRNDNFVYIVDGVKSSDGQAHIPSLAIGSITVYTGGVPAAYGDFTGGCVVIESMGYFDWLNSQKK
ncbi:MAG: carboxypeptidase-like regulatory domain-containing protein [Bacteroidota bacterium]